MSSPFRRVPSVALLLLATSIFSIAEERELRVCADPNNMPFSNRQRAGFENRIAELVAHDLNVRLSYVWQRMGRGFVREFLNNSKCDLLVGIPNNYPAVLTTDPYYRSSYVFVARRDASFKVASFDSPELRGLRIGVQILEENYAPPGEALSRRGLQSELVGFDTVGANANSIIAAVADHHVDLAIVWGPLAGYFVREHGSDLVLNAVEPEVDPPGLPFTFSISMGVRKGNVALYEQLQKILTQRKTEIRKILDDYGVPELPLPSVVWAENGGL